MTDFSIKMGFYKIMGTNSKDVSVAFDGEVAGTLSVTSTDVDNPQYIEFTVNKDPGVYPCEISVTSNINDGESIGISNIFVKPSGEDSWKDVRANGPDNSDGSKICEDFASPKTFSSLFYDSSITLMIEVSPAHNPEVHQYIDRYGFVSLEEVVQWFDEQNTNNSLGFSTEKLEEMSANSTKIKGLISIRNDPTVRY